MNMRHTTSDTGTIAPAKRGAFARLGWGIVASVATAGLVLTAGIVVGVGASSIPSASAASRVTLPPTSGKVDYQLGGAYSLPKGVTVVTRDSQDYPAKGAYNICYINGFQTQPGDASGWKKNHKNLLVYAGGKPVIDKNWPDEMILNTSTTGKRTAIMKILKPLFTRCAAAGFKAVEIDNLDSYTRSKNKLTSTNNTAMAKLYAQTAHKLGMAIGQKNTAELASKLKKTVKFDFAVAEECYRWNECGAYKKVYGSHVIDIEYTDDLRGTFSQACKNPNTPNLTVLRDRDLTVRGHKDYVYDHC